MNDCKKEEMNTLLSEAYWNQEVFVFTLPLLPFSHKRSLNSNLGKVVLWDMSPPPPQSPGFPDKVAVPCSIISRFIGLSYAELCELGLSKVMIM